MLSDLVQSAAALKKLDRRTPDGLFVSVEGTYHWIFSDFRHRYAVQLTTTRDRPAFSFHRLSGFAVANGLHLGDVNLKVGSPYEGSRNNRIGLVIRRGLRTYLKTSDERGRAVALLILPYWYSSAPDWSIFYSDWRLEVSESGPLSHVFNSPAAPVRVEPYEEMGSVFRLLTTLKEGPPCSDENDEDEEVEKDDKD